MLDVPHETIVEDYLMTNTCDVLEFTLRQYHARPGVAAGDHPLETMPDDIRRVLFAAHVDYLHAAFDQMAHDHGEVNEYLHREVGVDEVMRSKVQAALLSAG